MDDQTDALAGSIRNMSESFDLETVLSEVVGGARVLTGARLGIIATVDDSGVPRHHVFSGFTSEEERELVSWPGGPRLVEHLHELPGPLRVEDLRPYVRERGMTAPSIFPGAFQGMPVRYQNTSVGYLFLSDKADGTSFTAADEKVLMLFASQAAVAIGNVFAHLSEQRARMNLEALIETSPVGVIVFDSRSGQIASSNREVQRIVKNLSKQGIPLERLFEVVVCRRADGQEVLLTDFLRAEHFANAETTRGEEVVLSIPDGRSLRTLINAVRVRAKEDMTESVVVTVQDLAPLEEIERMRTEFLSLVGHELRAPLTSIKGSAATLLEQSEALDPLEMRESHRIIAEQADHMRGLIADLLDAGRIDSGTLSVSPEPSTLADMVKQARRTFLTANAGRSVLVDLPDGLPPVMADRQRIVQVLNNLLANAARHTTAASMIRVTAEREGQDVAVTVSDNGAGLPAELLPHLFRKHAGSVSGAASHGLGLAICKGLVEAHGGRIRAASDGPGRGTTITFTVPAAEPDQANSEHTSGKPSAPASSERTRILVVDDDPNMLRLVRDMLDAAGYEPLVTGAPEDLARLIRTQRPQLVLLDLLLPDRNGLELLQEIPELSDLPVIVISGHGSDETIARAFELGIDDYIVKPFSTTELVARIRAALRRQQKPEPFVLGELEIQYESREVTVSGKAVNLTVTEFDLLRLLSVNAGRISRYETLLRQIWSEREDPDPNLVRIFVCNLRRKLGDSAADPAWIFNQRGVGFYMPKPDKG